MRILRSIAAGLLLAGMFSPPAWADDVETLRAALFGGLSEAEKAVIDTTTREAHALMGQWPEPGYPLLQADMYVRMQTERRDFRKRLKAANALANLRTAAAQAVLSQAASAPEIPVKVRESIAKWMLPQ